MSLAHNAGIMHGNHMLLCGGVSVKFLRCLQESCVSHTVCIDGCHIMPVEVGGPNGCGYMGLAVITCQGCRVLF